MGIGFLWRAKTTERTRLDERPSMRHCQKIDGGCEHCLYERLGFVRQGLMFDVGYHLSGHVSDGNIRDISV